MHTATNRHSRRGSSRARKPFSGSTRGASSRGNFHTRFKKSGGGNPPAHFHRGGGRGKRNMPAFNPSQFINTNPRDIAPEVYTPTHTFSDFGLDARIVQILSQAGMEHPTPIQDQIIPEILAGKDVVGLAETGTGKTAAFLLPLIHKTLGDPHRKTLILAPTRELAIQIQAELFVLARGLRFFATTCVGGMNIRPQIRSLSRPNHFIIGTPGRVLDLINRGTLTTQNITTVVLDEADRMLDMGFIHDMRAIISKTPSTRETLFFSATMSPKTNTLVAQFLKNPTAISVKKKDVTESIEQNVLPYHPEQKFETLLTELEKPEYTRVIIFGAMKHAVEKLSRALSAKGIKAESLHGNKVHTARQRALTSFKNGSARVLVATDVAARGIHVDDVSHVINYDLPTSFEDYVHRIGRTGRSTKKGKALTFIPKE